MAVRNSTTQAFRADNGIGGFDSGTKDTLWPGEMIQQSVSNGYPIIHVELNYRVGSEHVT